MSPESPSNIPDILKPFDQYSVQPAVQSDAADCRDEIRDKVKYAMAAIQLSNASCSQLIGSIDSEQIDSGSLNIDLDTVEEEAMPSQTEKVTLDVLRNQEWLEIRKWNIPGVEPGRVTVNFAIVAGGSVFAEQRSINRHQKIIFRLPQGPFALIAHLLVSPEERKFKMRKLR